MALITSSRPGRGQADGSQATDVRVVEQQGTGTTATTEDDGTQGVDNANGTPVGGNHMQGHRGGGRAENYHANMHRAISGPIWGASLLDQDAGSGDDGTDSDGTTGT